MFGLRACVFRFGNVVGRRQTHGVGFDFVRKLLADPTRLSILGDGFVDHVDYRSDPKPSLKIVHGTQSG